uniref:Predicted protein n=1 Tax=Hordeum vulgare subsp. vulgare TaxID=112509 RepID=F2EBP0_HORVV|nr:predicted protein [Hordeum vulgare subsp. vulgare]
MDAVSSPERVHSLSATGGALCYQKSPSGSTLFLSLRAGGRRRTRQVASTCR